MTFLTLLLGLGASCLGAASREEHAAPQLEQSWVHSSLILFLRTAGSEALAVCFLLDQNTAAKAAPLLYHKSAQETTRRAARLFQSADA